MIHNDPRTMSARHKAFVEGVMRDNRYRRLAQQAKQARRRRHSRRVDWLLCELDFRRVALAERLARCPLAQWILRGEETSLFSAGQCR